MYLSCFLLFLKPDSPASQLFLFKYPLMNNDRNVSLRERTEERDGGEWVRWSLYWMYLALYLCAAQVIVPYITLSTLTLLLYIYSKKIKKTQWEYYNHQHWLWSSVHYKHIPATTICSASPLTYSFSSLSLAHIPHSASSNHSGIRSQRRNIFLVIKPYSTRQVSPRGRSSAHVSVMSSDVLDHVLHCMFDPDYTEPGTSTVSPFPSILYHPQQFNALSFPYNEI